MIGLGFCNLPACARLFNITESERTSLMASRDIGVNLSRGIESSPLPPACFDLEQANGVAQVKSFCNGPKDGRGRWAFTVGITHISVVP